MRSSGVSRPERLRWAEAICHRFAKPEEVIFVGLSGSTEASEDRAQTSV
jgi:hypothetical protein